jgi:hypothetical protein
MQYKTLSFLFVAVTGILLLVCCGENKTAQQTAATPFFGGYESQEKWGHHLVAVGGCGDCHTPKKMTPMGPVQDSALLLSGHPSVVPIPDIDRKMLESKGMAATQTLTAWVGPWGVSFAANLTPDSTGLLAWTEEQFITAMHEGFSKGIKGNRRILPPMPIEATVNFTNDELKAIFAYLKTIPPIKNVVPQPLPPVAPPPPPPAAAN